MQSAAGSFTSLNTTRFTEPEKFCPMPRVKDSEINFNHCTLTRDVLKAKGLRGQVTPDKGESDGVSTACHTDDILPSSFSDSRSDLGDAVFDTVEVKKLVKSCMREAGETVAPWDEACLTFVKTLQGAERNQGRVDLMEDIKGGKFAVKKMPTKWVTKSQEEFNTTYGEQTEQPWMDIAIVKYLQSRNIDYVCQHVGMFRDDVSTYVVSELASEGDAFSWCTRGPLPCAAREGAIRPVVRQMMSAISWIHDLGIAHRDISLENVLLHKCPETGVLLVKIIDFGMATVSRYGKEVVGKPSYQAPEMHDENVTRYDGYRADAFSLGVCLYTLAAKAYPWFSTRPGHCRKFKAHSVLGFRGYLECRKVPETKTPMLAVLSPELVDLLEALLDVNPTRRITLGERCWDMDIQTSVWDMSWMENES